jgi:hypothetical protein
MGVWRSVARRRIKFLFFWRLERRIAALNALIIANEELKPMPTLYIKPVITLSF